MIFFVTLKCQFCQRLSNHPRNRSVALFSYERTQILFIFINTARIIIESIYAQWKETLASLI